MYRNTDTCGYNQTNQASVSLKEPTRKGIINFSYHVFKSQRNHIDIINNNMNNNVVIVFEK